MVISTYSEVFQATAVDGGTALAIVMGNDHAVHHKAPILELRPQAQHVFVIGNAQILTDLVLLNIEGADDDDYLSTGTQLLEHPELAVGLESGQYSAGMMVVEELAAQLKVQLAGELRNALLNVLRLNGNVFVVVESVLHLITSFTAFKLQRYKIILKSSFLILNFFVILHKK